MTRPLRVAYFLSHPIQYQSGMIAHLAALEELEIKVFYGFEPPEEGTVEVQFARQLAWDVPLLSGYDYEFLPRLVGSSRPTALRPINFGVKRRLEEGRFDLLWIHGWGRLQDHLAFAAAKRLGLPILLRSENILATARRGRGPAGWIKARLRRRMIEGADAIGYVGSANRHYYEALGVPRERLFFMPYMVDNAWWRAASAEAETEERKAALDEALGLESDRPVILFAAKFIARKGGREIIAAYRALYGDQPADKRPYLLMVGSGPLEEDWRAAAEGLPDVRFLGFKNQSELPALYARADLFVMPSRAEQYGLALSEALNCGCALLASDECGGAADLIAPDAEGWGVTGGVYRAGDQADLENRLEALLEDRARLERMKTAGPRVIDGFSAEQVGEGLLAACAYLREKKKL